MKSVLIRGPLLTQSGYGVHSRQVFRWLLSKKDVKITCQVLPWGMTPWYVDKNALDGLVGEIMQRSGQLQKTPYDVTLQVQLPNEWDKSLGNFNVGITAAVETDRCNPEWVSACNSVDMVIVPSNHSKANLVNSGDVKSKMMIVPESFADEIKKSANELPIAQLPTFSTPFNFLIFGQITGNNPYNDRKNIFLSIKWLLEAFENDKDVGIVLKTNSGRNTLIDKNTVTNIVVQIINEIRKDKKFPRVHLLHGEMSDAEVAALYKHPQIKALVSLTRGEGYGLPILESAASGLPVIATNWSGHLDFLNHGKFISIYHTLEQVHQSRVDGKIFVKEARWAQPSEQDFKKRVVKFRNSSETPKEWAKELSHKLLERYSFDGISKQYDTVFEGII